VLRVFTSPCWRRSSDCASRWFACDAWGVLDIRNEHYQIGGHDYPNGILVDGHRHYWHLYFTWYFLPYKWIHGYQFD
jgi:hypothetical protein